MMVRDLAKIQKEITRRRNQLQQVVAVTFPELKSTGLTQREKKNNHEWHEGHEKSVALRAIRGSKSLTCLSLSPALQIVP